MSPDPVSPIPLAPSPVAVDLAADAAGETRPPAEPPPLPPPGTDRTKFWESGAAKSAVVATVVLVNAILRPHLVRWLGDANAVLAEVAVWAWLAAVGIQRTDSNALRWK